MNASYDKARKPYVPIDTCSPGGTWVEERRYNRVRPGLSTDGTQGGGGVSELDASRRPRRVLCGNWQEEDALERDLLAIQAAQQAPGSEASTVTASSSSSTLHGTGCGSGGAPPRIPDLVQSGWSPRVTTEVITKQKNGRYTGGHTSTPYLTCDPRHPALRDLDSTYRADYNTMSSNVASQRRPDLGVRQQRLLAQAMTVATETQKANAAVREARLAAATVGSFDKSGSRKLGANVSEYYATMCDGSEVLPVVEALSTAYLEEEPITIYTGNPATGKAMTVHGKTPADPMSASRFGKHTHFTENKYAY